MKNASMGIIAVDRTVRDLRAGVPVLVYDDAGAVVISAAEYGIDAATSLETLTGTAPALLLSAERASTLGLGKTALRFIRHAMDADILQALVDPTLPQSAVADVKALPVQAAAQLDNALLQLAKYAELLPALLVTPVEAKGEEAKAWAQAHDLLSCPAGDITRYSTMLAESIVEVSEAHVPLADAGTFRIKTYRPRHGGPEHLALIAGEPDKSTQPVPIRLHSSCLTGDILGSLRCDCGEQLHKAILEVGQSGCGIVLYLNQEGRGIGIANKLKAYQLQDEGKDTFDANALLGYGDDERDYSIAAAILKQLHITHIKLMTNNPRKIAQLQQHGITVAERLAHHVEANEVNAGYLEAKRSKGGHLA